VCVLCVEYLGRFTVNVRLEIVTLGKQYRNRYPEHGGTAIGDGVQHILQGDCAGKLAAEPIEFFAVSCPLVGADCLATHPCRQIADHDSADGEHRQSDGTLGIGDVKGVVRRQKEEIETQHAQ